MRKNPEIFRLAKKYWNQLLASEIWANSSKDKIRAGASTKFTLCFNEAEFELQRSSIWAQRSSIWATLKRNYRLNNEALGASADTLRASKLWASELKAHSELKRRCGTASSMLYRASTKLSWSFNGAELKLQRSWVKASTECGWSYNEAHFKLQLILVETSTNPGQSFNDAIAHCVDDLNIAYEGNLSVARNDGICLEWRNSLWQEELSVYVQNTHTRYTTVYEDVVKVV